ncbi:phage tail terminator protein [Pseudomonas protegens]|uniref:phage tail terminator protein n=1 Tax=Pseudomonas protegens TaxID=380021 RepID=UPI0022810A0D|nr:hypothetical protein [Pseudomonas protegens]MCY7262725.1 hypothetical protein [Pseudomonas protegens]
MKLNPVVAQLRATCPTFAHRVTGGIDWDAVAESAKLDLPAAYVIASADAADDNIAQNAVIQRITDQFAVVVVLEATDERGQEANDFLHDIRAELWRALVGWKPAPEYTPLEYGKGALLHISRARVVYQMTFVAAFQLGRNFPEQPAETWLEVVEDGFIPFEGIGINVDFIDPMRDPNLSTTGPDGRIEIKAREDLNP